MDNGVQQSGVDDTNLSGISDNLEEFLKNWADDDIDPADTAKMLHSPEGAQYTGWLSQELLGAYQSGALTPEFLTMACNRQFTSAAEVSEWLRSIWQLWFDKPFPVPEQPAPPAATA